MRAVAPTISVVVPTFNRASFLEAALESVAAQRECPSFETIVVDDGSTDATPILLASRRDVRTIRLPQRTGVAGARQAGAEAATGALLAFHDSDDAMLPGRLGRLAAVLEARPEVDAVVANGHVDGGHGTPGGAIVHPTLAARLDGQRIGIAHVLRDGLPAFLQASLIRRAVFEAVGGFDTTLARHGDLDLVCRLCLEAHVLFIDVPAFRYRLHQENQSSDRLRLREGMVAVMRRLRAQHPEALLELGPGWFQRRERRHLYRIAWRHWMRAWTTGRARELVPAAAALRDALALQLARRPSA